VHEEDTLEAEHRSCEKCLLFRVENLREFVHYPYRGDPDQSVEDSPSEEVVPENTNSERTPDLTEEGVLQIRRDTMKEVLSGGNIERLIEDPPSPIRGIARKRKGEEVESEENK